MVLIVKKVVMLPLSICWPDMFLFIKRKPLVTKAKQVHTLIWQYSVITTIRLQDQIVDMKYSLGREVS